MGILFNVSALWSSVCITSLIMGKLLGLTKTDYTCFLIGSIIGFLLMIISILLRTIFPNAEALL